jgi:hypothetical protein
MECWNLQKTEEKEKNAEQKEPQEAKERNTFGNNMIAILNY